MQNIDYRFIHSAVVEYSILYMRSRYRDGHMYTSASIQGYRKTHCNMELLVGPYTFKDCGIFNTVHAKLARNMSFVHLHTFKSRKIHYNIEVLVYIHC